MAQTILACHPSLDRVQHSDWDCRCTSCDALGVCGKDVEMKELILHEPMNNISVTKTDTYIILRDTGNHSDVIYLTYKNAVKLADKINEWLLTSNK